ncbi:hypothetical protein CI105_02810 [Candidatus Izimaplasma bacterium ZiA1]|uniref:hypothetical protein n=1 Tax=Candidatus Izimoplasma sp. ZiA1 TaxID=2024899 RepID=UPI000BAA5735|nr:hypothetical protein CI105_02810 [Candidatus Izimaplasma bacterium ZiA1]
MKKLIIMLIVVFMLFNKDVFALTIYDFLPAGVNYLDEENLSYTNNGFMLNEPIRVKPNTTYTFSFPGLDLLGNETIVMISGDVTYINEEVNNVINCELDYEISHCTFTTTSNVEKIYLHFEATRFYEFDSYYGFTNFQLEEGSVYTNYEQYIAPDVDLMPPSFNSSGIYTVAYTANENIAVIIDSHINVIDNCDGDISDSIIILEDNYTGYETSIGEYLVKLKVTDSSGNIATFDLIIMVVDDVPPLIIGPDTIEISCDDSLGLNDIINLYYSANDGYESELGLLVSTDEYSGFEGIIGEYNLILEATDTSLNKTVKNVVISIVDKIAPVINGNLEYDFLMSSNNSLIEIINSFEYSDNYYGKSEIQIEIIYDDFSENKKIVGEYYTKILLRDLSNNESVYDIIINCIDDIPPVLTNSTEFMISSENEIDLSNIVNAFIVSDNCDELLVSDIYIIENLYSNNKTSVGSKRIVFGLRDFSDNIATFTINISVIDNIPPIIYIDSYIIEVDNTINLTNDDILRVLKQNNEVGPESVISNISVNEYQEMTSIPGTYLLSLDLSDGTETISKELLIKVNGDNEKTYSLKTIITYSVTLSFVGFVIVKKIISK